MTLLTVSRLHRAAPAADTLVGHARSISWGTAHLSLWMRAAGLSVSAGLGELTHWEALLLAAEGQSASGGSADLILWPTRHLEATARSASAGASDLSLREALQISGAGQAASAGSGVVTDWEAVILAGQGLAAASSQASLDRLRSLVGAGGVASGADATLGRRRALLGVARTASGASAVASRGRSRSGVGEAASAGYGGNTRRRAAFGSGASASYMQADLFTSTSRLISARGRSASVAVGSMVVSVAVAGTGQAAAASVGRLDVQRPIAGSGAAASAMEGSAARARSLAATGAAATAANAELEVFGITWLEASGVAASSASGEATRRRALAASGASAVAATGAVVLGRAIEGAGAAASTASGELAVGSVVSLEATSVAQEPEFSLISTAHGASLTSHTFNKPADLEPGDILFIAARTLTQNLTSRPSGWVNVNSFIDYKVVTDPGAEPSSYTYTWGAIGKSVSTFRIRGLDEDFIEGIVLTGLTSNPPIVASPAAPSDGRVRAFFAWMATFAGGLNHSILGATGGTTDPLDMLYSMGSIPRPNRASLTMVEENEQPSSVTWSTSMTLNGWGGFNILLNTKILVAAPSASSGSGDLTRRRTLVASGIAASAMESADLDVIAAPIALMGAGASASASFASLEVVVVVPVELSGLGASVSAGWGALEPPIFVHLVSTMRIDEPEFQFIDAHDDDGVSIGSFTFDRPEDLEPGDVLFFSSRSLTSNLNQRPSGWVNLNAHFDYMVITDPEAEPDSYTYVWNFAARRSIAVFRIRNLDGNNPIADNRTQFGTTYPPIVGPILSPPSDGHPRAYFNWVSSIVNTSPGSVDLPHSLDDVNSETARPLQVMYRRSGPMVHPTQAVMALMKKNEQLPPVVWTTTLATASWAGVSLLLNRQYATSASASVGRGSLSTGNLPRAKGASASGGFGALVGGVLGFGGTANWWTTDNEVQDFVNYRLAVANEGIQWVEWRKCFVRPRGNHVILSDDMFRWETALNVFPTGSQISSIVLVPEMSLMIAVGTNGYISRSHDGRNWSAPTQLGTSTIFSGASSPDLGLILLRSNSTDLWSSSDGVNWSIKSTPFAFAIGRIEWVPSQGIFLAQRSNEVRTSTDGEVWTEIPAYPVHGSLRVCWMEGFDLWLLYAQDQPAHPSGIPPTRAWHTSPDLENWTQITNPISGYHLFNVVASLLGTGVAVVGGTSQTGAGTGGSPQPRLSRSVSPTLTPWSTVSLPYATTTLSRNINDLVWAPHHVLKTRLTAAGTSASVGVMRRYAGRGASASAGYAAVGVKLLAGRGRSASRGAGELGFVQTQYLYPASDVTVGDFIPTPLWSRLNDMDEATFISDDQSATTGECLLDAGTEPLTPGLMTLRVRYRKDAGFANERNITISIVEGTTVRGSSTRNNIPHTWETWEVSVDPAVVSNFANLRARIVTSGTTGGNPNNRRSVLVSWAELELPG